MIGQVEEREREKGKRGREEKLRGNVREGGGVRRKSKEGT